mmetsp:Transcript_2533/g.5435  ORF Transcript_2533/g.5435 Transcript_2533/m.5435 type:complete len:995 (+) Transcript_2533:78-3062(+)
MLGCYQQQVIADAALPQDAGITGPEAHAGARRLRPVACGVQPDVLPKRLRRDEPLVPMVHGYGGPSNISPFFQQQLWEPQPPQGHEVDRSHFERALCAQLEETEAHATFSQAAFASIDKHMAKRGLSCQPRDQDLVEKENAPLFQPEHRQSGKLAQQQSSGLACLAAPHGGADSFSVNVTPRPAAATVQRAMPLVAAQAVDPAPVRQGVAWSAQLSHEQFEAAQASFGEPLLVLAGPGSGKTAFLVARVARCLCEQITSADRVAIMTFTSRAAQELLVRVQKQAKAISQAQTARPWVGTMHALALRLLREAGGQAARVATEEQRRVAARQCLTEFDAALSPLLGSMNLDGILSDDSGDENEGGSGHTGGWPARAHESRQGKVTALLRLLRHIKQQPQQWAPVCEQHPALHSAQARFKRILQRQQLLDVADIVDDAIRLLEESSRARQWAATHIQQLFVDEWQDTDEKQVSFLKLLLQGRQTVSAVGDDDQQIYSWRRCVEGAAPAEVFRRAWAGSRIMTLGINFRCSPAIVHVSTKLIAKNVLREEKLLRAAKQESQREVAVVVKQTAVAEAAFIAAEICRLRKADEDTAPLADLGKPVAAERPWSCFAVLARTNAGLAAVEQALIKMNAPCHIARRSRDATAPGAASTARPSGRSMDAIAYLRLTIDLDHDPSFLRVCNLPRRGLGKKALQTLCESFGAHTATADRNPLEGALALSPEKAASAVASFPGLGGDEKASHAVAMRRLLEQTGRAPAKVLEGFSLFNKCLTRLREVAASASSAADVLQEVLKVLARGEGANDVGVARLLQEASRYKPSMTTPNGAACVARFLADLANGNMGMRDSVTLSTIHGAKGLEWDTVFVLHCCEHTLPLKRLVEGQDGSQNIEEERRLLYVAMTRAREHLVLSSPLCDCHGQATEPSRFLHEAGLLDVAGRDEQQPPCMRVAHNQVLNQAGRQNVEGCGMTGFQTARKMLPHAGQPTGLPYQHVITVDDLC